MNVAVAANKMLPGVWPPGYRNKTYDWREPARSQQNTRGVTPAYRITELRAALEATYRSDAHLVLYYVPGLERQPRITKSGLPWFVSTGTPMPVVDVFFADVDNPDHASWTDELRAAFETLRATAPSLQTAGIYFTTHGYRVVQPIWRAIPADEAERYIGAWLLTLENDGVVVDHHCRDWTRHYRLPNVVREGRPYRTPLLDLSRMTTIELPELLPVETKITIRKSTRDILVRDVAPVDFAADLSPTWRGRVAPIAHAVRNVQGVWHALFLALAGSLLNAGVPPEQVPVICGAVSREAGDTVTEDRIAGARSTVDRYMAGQPYTTLRRDYPTVDAAIDSLLVSGPAAALRAECAADPAGHPPASEAAARLTRAILDAPDGVSVIVAGCGIGKTRAAEAAAIERAAKPGKRPPQSKTAISVNTNALAIQITADLRSQGHAVRRLFSPLAMMRDDGTPECRYHDAAKAMQSGGQSVQREFCEGRGKSPCPFRSECRAADGVEGPDDARITVGNHGLIDNLNAAAGTMGMLVVDEPPSILDTVSFTLADLESADRFRFVFDYRFKHAMRPALQAITEWMRTTRNLDAPGPIGNAILDGAIAITDEAFEDAITSTNIAPTRSRGHDAVTAVKLAIAEGHPSFSPPVRKTEIFRARESAGFAAEIGRASRVLGAIYRALTTESPPIVRVEMRGDERHMVITGPHQGYVDALRREGSCVVLDATPDVAVIEHAIGYEPHVTQVYAADGAPIARTMIRWSNGTRRQLFNAGRLRIDRVASALRVLIAWAREDAEARTLGLITLHRIHMAIDPSVTEGTYREGGGTILEYREAHEAIDPILATWPGTILFGHYGGVRGLDHMKACDALATFADPWPLLTDVREGSLYLGMGDQWEARMRAQCQGELEQAHGRIRAPHRDRPGRALVMGNVLPSGPGWDGGVEFRQLEAGRPKNVAGMSASDMADWMALLNLSQRQAAAMLDISQRAVSNYLAGDRAIPTAIATRVATSTLSTK